jgi:hypothetical protein
VNLKQSLRAAAVGVSGAPGRQSASGLLEIEPLFATCFLLAARLQPAFSQRVPA